MSLGSLEDPDYGNYGIEFSPYDRFLYVSENSGTPNGNNIYQFDLLAGTSSAINNSRTVIWTFPATQGEPGALQLGPDGKIYLAVWTRSALSIIEYPDSLGSATSFIEDGISLGGATSLGGLPSKPNSFGHPYIEASNFCFGVTSYFSVIAQTEIDSVNWSFGDPSTGAANFSNSFDSQHVFSQPGIFEIQLILYQNLMIDTISSFIEIRSREHNQILGNDSTLCQGESINLDCPLYTSYAAAE